MYTPNLPRTTGDYPSSSASSTRLYAGLVPTFGGLCLVAAAASSPFPAQDGLAFAAAAELALAGQTGGYPTPDLALTQPFLEHYCTGLPDCESMAVPFLSPPPMLLLLALLALTGAPILFLRLLGALSLGVGAWLLYGALRNHAPLLRTFPLGLLLLLPAAIRPIENGQNSTWLFLTLAVGLSGPSVARAVLVAVVGLAKLTPWGMAALLLWERDARGMGVFVVVLAAGFAFSTVLPEGFAVYFDRMASISPSLMAHPENVSPRVWLGDLWVVGAVLSGLHRMRRLDKADRWALAWLLWLVAVPLAWTHYLWVGFGAVWWLVGRRLRTERAALGLATWCLVGSMMGPYTAAWLVTTWLGTLVLLSRRPLAIDIVRPSDR